jgi:triacylglycerol lipase
MRAAFGRAQETYSVASGGDRLKEAEGIPGDYVVLLHGLGRTQISMKGLEWTLRRQSYQVINCSYPSRAHTIEDLADTCLARLLTEKIKRPDCKVHFVTHSLGGIILRHYLAGHVIEKLGRVIMLGPPNQGSELAECSRRRFWYRAFTGPAGQQLGTGAESLPRRLGPMDAEVGTIAGDRYLNPFFAGRFGGANDGKVAVASTKVDGMADFLLVHHSHTWMMWTRKVQKAVVSFLRDGKFSGQNPLS